MFDKNVKEDLLALKKGLQSEYISIFNDGWTCKDTGSDALYKQEDKLNDCCSSIDYHLKKAIENLCNSNIDFDKVEYEFLFGLIFNKDSLGENNEILPTSTPLKNRVRYYTGNVKAYNNGELVKELSIENMINYQGYINYEKLINQINKENLILTGPQSFQELQELITSGQHQSISLTIDLNNIKEKSSEEIKVQEEVKQEVKTKKRSLFRK